MMYRIAMVAACPYPAPQGSQVLLQGTAVALRDRGHEVHLVVYGHGSGTDDSGLKVHRSIRFSGVARIAAGPYPTKPLLDLALVNTLRHVLRTQTFDVIHAHNYEGLLVSLMARARLPIVYHAHNAMADELPHFWKHAAPFGRWLDRTFPRRADVIIAPHQRLADYLGECGCERARIHVIPPSIDARLFKVSPCSDAIPPVLYTGNLDPYQNLGLLFQSMALVRKRIPQARLQVATAQHGQIPNAEMIPAPDFDALLRILAQDSVVACPRVSWSGYPIKLLNAMAAGKAIVACENAAYPLEHEKSGIIVPNNDAEAFSEALIRLLQDSQLRERLGTNAREAALAHHAPEPMAYAIEAVYCEVVEQTRTMANAHF